jgi:protein-tyrosine phosphatase
MNYNDKKSDKPVNQVSNDQSNEDLVSLTGVLTSIKETVMRDQGRHEETADHAVKEKKFIESELED